MALFRCGNGFIESVLWANSNPTAVGLQDFTLDASMSGYKYIKFEIIRSLTNPTETFEVVIPYDTFVKAKKNTDNTRTFAVEFGYAAGTGTEYGRHFYYVDDSTFGIGLASGSSSNNSYSVPVKVTGIK